MLNNDCNKVSDKIQNVYADAVFGFPAWNKDQNKLVFIGELAEPTFSSYFEKKEETNKENTEISQKEEKVENQKKKDEKKKD